MLAALLNALKVVGKNLKDVKIVLNGAGAAGTAITNHLLDAGAKNIVVCDKFGILNKNDENLSKAHKELSKRTNPNGETGELKDAIKSADVFIGVSAPGILKEDMVRSMNKDAIVFAMANPTPEIMPDLAKKAGARILGTGRSDFSNQINNVLVFPGLFRGALDSRARNITKEMKLACSYAIASLIPENELNEENIISRALDKKVSMVVAEAVKKAAK